MRRILLWIMIVILLVATVIFIGCSGSDDTAATEEATTFVGGKTEEPTAIAYASTTSEETKDIGLIELPFAPTDGYEVLELDNIYQPAWDGEPTLPRLIRTQEEFDTLPIAAKIKLDAEFSFDTHSIVAVEFQFVSSERLVELYGFDLIDGKVSPIFTFEKVESTAEDVFRAAVLISVPAYDIAGEMGEVLVVNLTEPGEGSRYYRSYIEVETEVDTIPYDEPHAPTKIHSYMPLGRSAFGNWDATKQAVLVRSWNELNVLLPRKDLILVPPGFSFDYSSIIIAEFKHHSGEKLIDFYGFDVVDGKICTILTVDTPTDPNAAIPDDEISSFVMVTVAADSIAGEMGDVLVVVDGHNGHNSQCHNGYKVKAPSKIIWSVELGGMLNKTWSYNDTFLVRSQAEFDKLGLDFVFNNYEGSFFESNWLVLAKFNLAGSDENVEFYGFDIREGVIRPIMSVEAPAGYGSLDMTKTWFLVCIPKDSLAGQFGAGLALNTRNPGSGSAYHMPYVPEA